MYVLVCKQIDFVVMTIVVDNNNVMQMLKLIAVRILTIYSFNILRLLQIKR